MNKQFVGLFLFLLFAPLCLFAQSSRFFTLSNVKARPLAMGGAFMSITDDVASIDFNPAGYFLSENEDSRHVHLFLNPVSPFVHGLNKSELGW